MVARKQIWNSINPPRLLPISIKSSFMMQGLIRYWSHKLNLHVRTLLWAMLMRFSKALLCSFPLHVALVFPLIEFWDKDKKKERIQVKEELCAHLIWLCLCCCLQFISAPRIGYVGRLFHELQKNIFRGRNEHRKPISYLTVVINKTPEPKEEWIKKLHHR